MTLLEFLRRVIPDAGPYFHSRISQAGKWSDQRVDDLEALERAVTGATAKSLDSFFGTSSYRTRGGRTQTNVVLKRVWYLDIDCKPDGSGQYLTLKDGLQALRDAIAAGLPSPTFVTSTGHGWHYYVVTDEEVGSLQWKQLAQALLALCGAVGLKVDTKVCLDETRVLRAPTTVNWKDRNAPKVCELKVAKAENYSLADLTEVLQPYLTGPTAVPNPPPAAAAVDPNTPSDLETGLPEGQTAYATTMIEQCAMLGDMLKRGGDTDKGTMWHKVIHTLAYTEDGADFIHPISQNHPTYSHDDTERRFAYAKRQKDRFGPTLCATFKDESADSHCSECPFNGRIKSPISLGFRQWSGLPQGWRNVDGRLCRWEAGDEGDGKWTPVASREVTNVAPMMVDDELMFEITLSGTVVRCNHAAAADNRSIYAAISPSGVLLQDWERNGIRGVIMAWIDGIRDRTSVPNARSTYGWADHGFVVGSTVYTGSHTLTALQKDRTMADTYTVEGDLDVWKRAAKMVLDHGNPALWCGLGGSFAAPLMRFTGETGALLALTSNRSGTGKSTAIKVGQAVWGRPNATAMVNDTPNSVAHRLGMLNNLPMYWDELRGDDDVSQFVKLVFRLSQGREKARLNATIEQRDAGEWETIMISGSNSSVVSYIQADGRMSDAGAMRVLELDVPQRAGGEKNAPQIIYALRDNYGVAGAVYANWLAANEDTARSIVLKFRDKLLDKLELKTEERFWVAIAASICAGMFLATKLKLLTCDVSYLKSYLIKQILTHRKNAHESSTDNAADTATDVLEQFLRATAMHGISGDSLPGVGRGNNGNPDGSSERAPSIWRIGRTDGKLAFVKREFRNFVERNVHGSNYLRLLSDLTSSSHGRERQLNLDSGTGRQGFRTICIELNLTSPSLRHLQDFATADESGHSSSLEDSDSPTEASVSHPL